MSITSVDNGTQTATIGTEHSLSTQTTPGIYIFAVDLFNLAAGDIVELRVKTIAKPGGTSHGAFYKQFTYADILNDSVKYSPPVPIDSEIIATLKQTAGTGRDFDWNLLKL